MKRKFIIIVLTITIFSLLAISGYQQTSLLAVAGEFLPDNSITKIHNFFGRLTIKLGLTYERPFFEAPPKSVTQFSIIVLWIIFVLICCLIVLWKIPRIRKKIIRIIIKIILIVILFIIILWAVDILYFPEICPFLPQPPTPGWLD